MGVSNKIQDLNLNLTEHKCSQCQQPFTQEDKVENNWELWFDTSGEIELEHLEIINSNWWRFSLYFENITHKLITSKRLIKENPRTEEEWTYYNCPDTEKCQGCDNRFLSEKMKYIEYDSKTGQGDEYFCSPCYQQITSQEI